MREQWSDYEQRIDEKIRQEGEAISQALGEASSPPEGMDAGRLDGRVYREIDRYESRVAEASIPEGLSERDREALLLGRKIQNRRLALGRGRRWKRAAAVAAALVFAGSAGIVSVGGPRRVVEIVKTAVNQREIYKINVSSQETKASGAEREEQAYQQIEDELAIQPVRIVPTDKGMKYKSCQVDTELRVVQLLYAYGDRNLSYLLTDSYSEGMWGVDIEDRIVDEYSYTWDRLQAEITEYELPETEAHRYSAKFEYNGIFYQLTGTMSWQEFEDILKNLHFPA